MSQEPPRSPNSNPESSPPPSGQGVTTLAQIQQTLGKLWKQVQPLLLQQSIGLLRLTILGLNRGLSRLEEIAVNQGLETPAGDHELGAKVQRFFQHPLFRQLWQTWLRLLSWLRPRLPAKIQQWPDSLLTGAIAGLLLLLFWTTSALLPDQSPPVVARRPTPAPLSTQSPAPPLVTQIPPSPPPELIAPEPIQVLDQAPTAPPDRSLPLEPLLPAPQLSPSPSPIPAPVIQLSPEQALIEDIQNQLRQIGDQFSPALVSSVQVNAASSRLRLNLSDRWYILSPSEQNDLAQKLLERSHNLNFSKLELLDSQGNLLARNPVIGSTAIILQRNRA